MVGIESSVDYTEAPLQAERVLFVVICFRLIIVFSETVALNKRHASSREKSDSSDLFQVLNCTWFFVELHLDDIL